MASALGQPVTGAPADGITQVRFNEAGELVLASSWDGVSLGLLLDPAVQTTLCCWHLLWRAG